METTWIAFAPVVALVLFLFVAMALGASGHWVWGWQYRKLEQQYDELLRTASLGTAALAQTADRLEGKTPVQPLDERARRADLRRRLAGRFSETELANLAFDLGQDYDSLPGKAKEDKARELVEQMARHGRLDELERMARLERPDVWAAGAEK